MGKGRGDDRTSKIKDNYGSRFSGAQETRQIHKAEEIILQF